jgi:hypothetical protein
MQIQPTSYNIPKHNGIVALALAKNTDFFSLLQVFFFSRTYHLKNTQGSILVLRQNPAGLSSRL